MQHGSHGVCPTIFQERFSTCTWCCKTSKTRKINLAIACLLALFRIDTKQKYFCDLSTCVPTKKPQVYQDMTSCAVIPKEQSAKLAAKQSGKIWVVTSGIDWTAIQWPCLQSPLQWSSEVILQDYVTPWWGNSQNIVGQIKCSHLLSKAKTTSMHSLVDVH